MPAKGDIKCPCGKWIQAGYKMIDDRWVRLVEHLRDCGLALWNTDDHYMWTCRCGYTTSYRRGLVDHWRSMGGIKKHLTLTTLKEM